MADLDSLGIDSETLKRRLEKIQAKQKGAVEEVVDNLASSIEQPEVDDSHGEYQRLQFRIPTADNMEGTVISAGRQQEKRGYDGLGITTNRHVIVSAEGGKENSTMTLQSNGQLHLQSDDDSLYAVAKGPATMASSSGVNLVGAGGVVIDGGLAPTIENLVIEGEEPGFPKALDGFHGHMEKSAGVWGAWDETIQAEAEARDTAQDGMDPAVATEYAPVHSATALSNVVSATLSSNNALGKAQDTTEGAVGIQGEGGFFIGTPASGVIRSDNALTLSSKNSGIFGSLTADVHSESATSVTSLDQTSVHAGKNLHLVAKENKVHIGARDGEPVEIQAKDVHVGEMEPDAPQTPTDNVYLRALKHVSLTSENDPSRGRNDEGVFVDSHKVIECTAADTLTFKIADQEIKVVIDKGNTIDITAGQATISVDSSGGVTTKHMMAEVVAATDTVTVKGGSVSKVEVASSGVTVSGASIKLG